MNPPTTYTSEAGHWYTKKGEPMYEIPAKNGSLRPTTLRDARKLNLLPSVTAIIRQAAAPGLEQWKQKMVAVSALTHPGLTGSDEDVALILRDAQEQGREAAKRGTEIHYSLQKHFQGREVATEHQEHVLGAVEALQRAFGSLDDAKAEQSFGSELGYGGKIDLSSPSLIVDFKSKEFGPDSLPKTWDEHAYQLAAYRTGIKATGARCAICFVSVTDPGLSHVVELDEDELYRGWKCFHHLLEFWFASKNYRPVTA